MPKFSCRKISYPFEIISAISLLMNLLLKLDGEHQAHQFNQQQGQNNQGTGMPMPPPLTPEQFFQLQMQMMTTLNNTVQALQQVHTQPPSPPPP